VELVAGSDRVLICPDGPLHALPFTALRLDSGEATQSRARYLVEWKPLHTILSATVYDQLRSARPAAMPTDDRVLLAAFGDPEYPSASFDRAGPGVNLELRSALARAKTLAPLPASRAEVETIAGFYGARATTYLGEQATEQAARNVGASAWQVHFACHALLDERFPLDSALVLAIPDSPSEGEDNGLLQAWEIFEGVRIDADLVTLSGCETALGREMGGEGLIGLTRAFQYAGARSIVASLWSVADRSTAELMGRLS
jgi:CHAT domain-containing protein